MATPNSTESFLGFLKTNYASLVVNTIPNNLKLQRAAPFREAQRVGRNYQQATITSLEQGWTYATAGAGKFQINPERAGAIEDALVDGSQGVLKSGIDYETLSKAISAGKIAYGSSADQLYRNMVQSSRKRLEIDMWHGQSSLGIATVDITGVTATTFVLNTNNWVPGAWVGMEEMIISVYASDFSAVRRSVNAEQDYRVTQFDPVTRTVTVVSSRTGVAVDITSDVGGTFADGDVILLGPSGAPSASVPENGGGMYEFGRTEQGGPWNSMLGLLGISDFYQGTGRTLFNISADKSIWRPSGYAVGGNFSFAHAENMAALSVHKGLDRGATLYVSTQVWVDLLTEQAALRRYGGTFAGRVTLVNGGQAIEFHSSTGVLMIVPTIYLQNAFTILCPSNSLMRVGSSDVTFKVPGINETNLHIDADAAGISMRSYYMQALFTTEPGQITLGTGVTASGA